MKGKENRGVNVDSRTLRKWLIAYIVCFVIGILLLLGGVFTSMITTNWSYAILSPVGFVIMFAGIYFAAQYEKSKKSNIRLYMTPVLATVEGPLFNIRGTLGSAIIFYSLIRVFPVLFKDPRLVIVDIIFGPLMLVVGIMFLIWSIKRYKASVNPLLVKGIMAIKNGALEEATAHNDAVLKIEPNNWKAWNNKGVILYKQGKYTDAIICFDKAFPKGLAKINKKRTLTTLEYKPEVADQPMMKS